MVPQGDEGQEESFFGPFRDSANVDTRYGLLRIYHRLKFVLDAPYETLR
jgi:hypothetical protein